MPENKTLTLVIDVDGTLCPIKQSQERYEELIPYVQMVERLKEYKADGARIILYTSRNMNSYHGNIGLINANTAKILLNWLEQWEIPYDEIIYGKPWPGHFGFYIDDRAIRPDEFLNHSIVQLENICQNSRKELEK